jgi:hypothetical protein
LYEEATPPADVFSTRLRSYVDVEVTPPIVCSTMLELPS